MRARHLLTWYTCLAAAILGTLLGGGMVALTTLDGMGRAAAGVTLALLIRALVFRWLSPQGAPIPWTQRRRAVRAYKRIEQLLDETRESPWFGFNSECAVGFASIGSRWRPQVLRCADPVTAAEGAVLIESLTLFPPAPRVLRWVDLIPLRYDECGHTVVDEQRFASTTPPHESLRARARAMRLAVSAGAWLTAAELDELVAELELALELPPTAV